MSKNIKNHSNNNIKKAIESLNWNMLQKCLDDNPSDVDYLAKVCTHIRLFSDIVHKYPNPRRKQKRQRFFKNFVLYARNNYNSEAAKSVKHVYRLIIFIENGYHELVKTLNECEIQKQTAEIRVSAYIDRACQDYITLCKQIEEKYGGRDLFVSSDFYIEGLNGNQIDINSISEGLSKIFATTIIMESYKNNWFHDDIVVLPELVKVDERECYQAGSTFLLASHWAEWQRIEKMRRYLGGHFCQYKFEQDQKRIRYIEYVQSREALRNDFYDLVANTRLIDLFNNIFFDRHLKEYDSDSIAGVKEGASLPPDSYVTLGEKAAVESLSSLLSYSVLDDKEQPGGLRLLEWIRGYAILQELARSAFDKSGALATILSEAKLLRVFKRCGLNRKKAKDFLLLSSLNKSSRDMHDCPLVQLGGSDYLLFGPALLSTNISQALLSNLSTRHIDLSQKGNAFEKVVYDTFTLLGMETFQFKARREKEEFEYDAVVIFEDKIFIFECKSHSLSGRDPVQQYYFTEKIYDAVRQVKRLATALRLHPDIIKENMGESYVGKEIIPCVLNSFPYSRGNVDGVYVTDYSVLARFFSSPSIDFTVIDNSAGQTNTIEIPVSNVWNCNYITIGALIEQLENPIQLKVHYEHLDSQDVVFQLSDMMAIFRENYYITEKTPQSICKVLGTDSVAIW